MTSMLEEKIRAYKDSLEKEYGPFTEGLEMGMQVPSRRRRSEDD